MGWIKIETFIYNVQERLFFFLNIHIKMSSNNHGQCVFTWFSYHFSNTFRIFTKHWKHENFGISLCNIRMQINGDQVKFVYVVVNDICTICFQHHYILQNMEFLKFQLIKPNPKISTVLKMLQKKNARNNFYIKSCGVDGNKSLKEIIM